MNSDWLVPKHSEREFFLKKTKYCVVIPVINEGQRLHTQLQSMLEEKISEKADIIIADGGSNDGSLDRKHLRKYNVRALLTKEDTGKLSAQLRMAYAWCLEEGYAGIITIDGNNKDSVEHISDFIRELDNGVDYVQASRFLHGGKAVNTPLSRHIAIRLIHAPLVSIAARHWFTDTTQGYRAYSARYLLHPNVQPFREIFTDYELLAYLSARATRIGLTAKEIPTFRIYPKGKVPTKISALRGNFDLLKTLYDLVIGKFNPSRAV